MLLLMLTISLLLGVVAGIRHSIYPGFLSDRVVRTTTSSATDIIEIYKGNDRGGGGLGLGLLSSIDFELKQYLWICSV
eukprot:scaffold2844_cov123-Cylindrotheca_fusiformis.AAC.2